MSGEPMRFAELDRTGLHNRCANCGQPYMHHRARLSAPPSCPKGGEGYREMTDAEVDAAYRREFPGGPQPIAVFHADNPEDMELAKALLSPAALRAILAERAKP